MPDRTLRNSIIASVTTGLVATLLILAGWSSFEFDPALFLYAEVLILALVLTIYRFTIWLHRPPTLALFCNAFAMAKASERKSSLILHLCKRASGYFALNRFVFKRGTLRWSAHFPIMVGCVMAMAIVVPLICGWVWFETPANDLSQYHVMVFGQHVRTMPIDGAEAFVAFHGLVWASFPVILGCSVALWRRMRDRGDAAVQTFVGDIVPLIVLLAIATTGLAMTVSYSFLGGGFHKQIASTHMVIVCGTLLWLPYSKFFHIPQRSLKLAHMVYEYQAAVGPRAHCCRCGESFADQVQIDDLIRIQQVLGYEYKSDEADGHYQNVCPRCRRASFVIAQSARWQQVRTMPRPDSDHRGGHAV